MTRRRPVGERGSAPAEFAMVSALVVLVFLALLQLGLALHVRNTLVAAAVDGARHGARADASPVDGAARTRELARSGLGARGADTVTARRVNEGGADVVRVDVTAPLPVLGPWGPSKDLHVSGRALAERQ